MLRFLRDKFSTAQLKAQYERIVHEQLVELTEATHAAPVSEDPGEWTLVGNSKTEHSESSRSTLRDQARQLVQENPHACNILRMLEAYVTGPGLCCTHELKHSQRHQNTANPLNKTADSLWKTFLETNAKHYSYREHARRAWRDGETFIRKFPGENWPPQIRFVDPESIGPVSSAPDSQGIITAPHDVETPLVYLHHASPINQEVEQIPSDQMIQTRIGIDSNEKLGVSLFAPLVDSLNCYEKWLETELLARKLQSSIVLWRKVQGSPQLAENIANQSMPQSPGAIGAGHRREKFSPGTILTTNHGTEIQFLQPNTNFGDAASLGRMLLLSIAAGAGLPEFMLTADASNSNFASTMVAEGPAVKYFQSEQNRFADEFTKIWKWVMQEAINQQLLPDDFFDQISIKWTFPTLINRDRSKERLADAKLVETGVLSRAEVARRDGVDPTLMQEELSKETMSS